MAIYHLSLKEMRRSQGRSSVAAAAYIKKVEFLTNFLYYQMVQKIFKILLIFGMKLNVQKIEKIVLLHEK